MVQVLIIGILWTYHYVNLRGHSALADPRPWGVPGSKRNIYLPNEVFFQKGFLVSEIITLYESGYCMKCPDCCGQDWKVEVDGVKFTNILGFECCECGHCISLEAVPLEILNSGEVIGG